MRNKSMKNDLDYIYNELTDKEKDKFLDANIMISGAGGFIGYYMLNFLAEYVSELKIRNIIALDNFILGKPKWIEKLSKKYGFIHIFNHDIAHGKIEKIPEIEKCDSVIHMASIASPTYYRKYPLNTLDANVWGLRNVLNFFSEKEVRGFLNFSSSEVYGDPDQSKVPMSEDYAGNVAINGPRACYDEAKRFGETMCYVFNKEFGINIVSVRPFNNYGPGMKLNDARAPADFANAIVTNRDIEIFSDGLSTRTFTYISDAIVGYMKALFYGKFDYFNIGIDRPEITIDKLAEIYAQEGEKTFGHITKITHAVNNDSEYLIHNPKRRSPDIRKAREKLGFYPKIEVTEGVSRFLRYLKEGVE
jgi:UDP-glucuronate decarboxylase